MSQIKSKLRVKELAEVFTNEREVNAMLDLVKEYSYDITKRFLEPACGNGNFLIKILERKLKTVQELYSHKTLAEFEYRTILALSTIYGVDICPENVKESQDRLLHRVFDYFYLSRNTDFPSPNFEKSVRFVLNKNIILGNTLEDQEKMFFFEFLPQVKHSFNLKKYSFAELFNDKPTPIKRTMKKINYLELYKWRDR